MEKSNIKVEKLIIDEMKESNEVENIKTCKNCNQICDAYENPALHCSGGCDQNVHIRCLQKSSLSLSFVGDVFFDFNCANCNPLYEESVVRGKMPWVTILILVLYNLHEKSYGISKMGYFHWKSDIVNSVQKNWDYLFSRTTKRKKNWVGTISGILSHYTGSVFKSGTSDLGEAGWWALIDKDPPEILVAKNIKKKSKVQKKKDVKPLVDSLEPSDCSVSPLTEGNNTHIIELLKNQTKSIYSSSYVQPTETFDQMFQEEDLNDLDINIEDKLLCDNDKYPSVSDLIHSSQNIDNFHLAQLVDSYDNFLFINNTSPSNICDEVDKIKEKTTNENSNNSSVFMQDQAVTSLFKERTKRQWPWSRVFTPHEKIPRMMYSEEVYLLQTLKRTDLNAASFSVRRLYRKLAMRKIKRERGLALLNIDQIGSQALVIPSKENKRLFDRFIKTDVKYMVEHRMHASHYDESDLVHSPHTKRLLKPFIRRDTSSLPLWLKIIEELCAKVNKDDPEWTPSFRAPIDYCYVRPQHVPAINNLCRQFFWPGIDLSECLEYPDFTCVVLYRKLVIGFAVLIPNVERNEAYVSFFVVRPEWRKCGIGTFMLYHLIQSCMASDITLHVSATNTALMLYQKFGFKVEEFIQDFYDKYLPPNSRECKHALYLRLSR